MTNAFAYCESDTIKSRSPDGAIITLESGSTWEVDSADRADSSLWLPLDDVIMCDDSKMIHKDDSEEVDVTQVQ